MIRILPSAFKFWINMISEPTDRPSSGDASRIMMPSDVLIEATVVAAPMDAGNTAAALFGVKPLW
jgi:hypothetical protein